MYSIYYILCINKIQHTLSNICNLVNSYICKISNTYVICFVFLFTKIIFWKHKMYFKQFKQRIYLNC